MSNTAIPTITLPVTLQGETRDIEFTLSSDEQRAFSRSVLGARIGYSGTKVHRVSVIAWRQTDGSWRINYNTVALNRQAQAFCFLDEVSEMVRSHHHATA